jgi:hypothetical protein
VTNRSLIEALRAHLRNSWSLEIIRVQDPRLLLPLGTYFGAYPYAEAGEAWPRCPGCGSSLSFIGQFETLGCGATYLPSVGLFTFYYCWGCQPSGLINDVEGSWVVRIHPTPNLERRQPMLPNPPPLRITMPCSVQSSRLMSLPTWGEVVWAFGELRELASSIAPAEPFTAYQLARESLLGVVSVGTKLCGFADWLQDASRRACKLCRGPLQFVLQIDSLSEAGCDWGLAGLAYLLVCPQHPEEWALEIQRT